MILDVLWGAADLSQGRVPTAQFPCMGCLITGKNVTTSTFVIAPVHCIT